MSRSGGCVIFRTDGMEYGAPRCVDNLKTETDMRISALLPLAIGMACFISVHAEVSLHWRWDETNRTVAEPVQEFLANQSELDMNLVRKADASGISYRGMCFVVR